MSGSGRASAAMRQMKKGGGPVLRQLLRQEPLHRGEVALVFHTTPYSVGVETREGEMCFISHQDARALGLSF